MARRPAYGDLIAQAIHDADKRYFFEDYRAQAEAVLRALSNAGLMIVPRTASDDMMEAARNSLKFGAQRQDDLIRGLYTAMITTKT